MCSEMVFSLALGMVNLLLDLKVAYILAIENYFRHLEPQLQC